MVKLWFCWIFFVLFFNKVAGEKEAEEEDFNVGDVTYDLHANILIPLQLGDRSNDDYNNDYANKEDDEGDKANSDEIPGECPPDPLKNKCSKECRVINDDRGCSLCVCPSNLKAHDFEPNDDNIQRQQIFKSFPTEQHQSQSEVIENQNVPPTQILSKDWSNLFLNRNFTFTEKSDEMNKSSNFETVFDKEQSVAENETKIEVVEKMYSSTNETDPNTIADEILSGEIENERDEAEEELLFKYSVYVDVSDLFQSINIQNDNETHGMNNITLENGIDENRGHNETVYERIKMGRN